MSLHFPAFLNVLGRSIDDLTTWKTLSPGLVILRLVEQDEGDEDLQLAFDHARAAIDDIVHQALPPVPELLFGILTALSSDNGEREKQRAVVPPLIAYGNHLRDEGWYDLAGEVYETAERAMVRGDLALDDPATAGTLFLETATAATLGGHWDRARTYLDCAGWYANPPHSEFALRVRIRRGILESRLGKPSEALSIFNDVIAIAREVGLVQVEQLTLRARGGVLRTLTTVDHAIADYFRSYELAQQEKERELLLCDIAASMYDLGHVLVAKKIHDTLVGTTKIPLLRALSLTNLLEISVRLDDQASFHRYWEQVQRCKARKDAEIYAWYYRAQAVEKWESHDAALAAYRDVAARARQAGLHSMTDKIVSDLQRLNHDTPPSDVSKNEKSITQPINVDAIMNTIDQMCSERWASQTS